jgi:hypothetical protein
MGHAVPGESTEKSGPLDLSVWNLQEWEDSDRPGEDANACSCQLGRAAFRMSS